MLQLPGQGLRPDGHKGMQRQGGMKWEERGYKLGIISDVKPKIIQILWFNEFVKSQSSRTAEVGKVALILQCNAMDFTGLWKVPVSDGCLQPTSWELSPQCILIKHHSLFSGEQIQIRVQL